MQPSRTITLFSGLPPSRRAPSPFVVSTLLHVVVIGLFYFVLKHAVHVGEEPVERYTVRLLNLSQPETRVQRAAAASGARGGMELSAPRASQSAASQGGAPSAPALPVDLAQTIPAPQTLVQPDLPPNLLLPKETPIPIVLMWSPENNPARQIVPPPPRQKTAANVHPSLEKPNQELSLADLKINAIVMDTKTPTLPPSTTTPLVVRGPQPVAQAPTTASKPIGPPTPASVMSFSDLELQHGTIALPLVNETAAPGSSSALAPGRPGDSSGAGGGKPAATRSAEGAGQGAGNHGNLASAGGPGGANGPNAGPGIGSGLSPETASGSGPGIGSGPANVPSMVRIDLPKDGRFGVVVVGSSLAEEYPETVGLWSGRLAYTVYLHVGLAKSWILQYALPRSAEASVAGEVIKPEAPWPYLMERPQLAPGDTDADAIMVHGFVNITGRFEQLAIVFPPEFSQTKFVLNALQQWQFRPALENGKLTTVEVLLIIPDQEDE